VNKSVQTVSTFILSALVFGAAHEAERFTYAKGAALVLVILGVLLYALRSPQQSSEGDELVAVFSMHFCCCVSYGVRFKTGTSNTQHLKPPR
jgi:hypothetical protein